MASDSKKDKRFSATTPSKRFVKLSAMSTKIAAKVASNQAKAVFQTEAQKAESQTKLLTEIGIDVANTLGEMKGAVMKVGQVASQMKDLLPKEFAAALEKLQNESPPMPFRMIRKQFIKEFGSTPYELFSEIDDEPCAAASIGQVHKAKTHDGRDVIVKIQYPGVDESIDSDLKHLKYILKIGGLLKLDEASIEQLFDHIKEGLYEELNYQQEAKNLKAFAEFHKNDDKIVIPETIDELSSKRIITLSYEAGDNLETVTSSSEYNQETRNAIGTRLFSTVYNQMFNMKAFHCDPHPGNFAFRPDGSVVMYDFGAIQHLPEKAMVAYRSVLRASLRNQADLVDEPLITLGVRDANGPVISTDFYQEWIDILQPTIAEEGYDFSNCTLHKTIVKKSKEQGLTYINSFKPSIYSMQINRVFGGHYWTAVKLGAVVKFKEELELYLYG